MSKQTGSFLFIIVLAVVFAAAAYFIGKNQVATVPPADQNAPAPKTQTAVQPAPPDVEPLPTVDTGNWKTYTSISYPFTFKYPPTWKVTPHPNPKDFDTITAVAANDPSPINIYVSKTGYIGMEGLQTKPVTIGGQPGVSAQGLLQGVKYKNVYYTFDLGNSLKNQPEFQALINSATFK